MARPLAVIGFTYFLSLMAASVMGLSLTVVAAVLLALFFIFALIFRLFQRRVAVMAVLLTCVTALAAFAYHQVAVVIPQERMEGKNVPFTAVVLDEMLQESGSRCYIVTVTESMNLPKGTRLRLWTADRETAFDRYEVIRGEAANLRMLNSDSFFAASKADGILLQGVLSSGAEISIEGSRRPWYSFLYDIRDKLGGNIQGALPRQEGALLMSMCLGNKNTLSAEHEAAFRGAGLSHLLAVSGLHTSVIAGGVLALLKMLRVPKRASALVTGGVIIGFMIITGCTPSVMRAGIMCLVLLAGMLVNRQPDGLNSLGLALLLILVWDMDALYDIGLWLSFAAAWGLLVMVPFWRGYMQERPFWKKYKMLLPVMNALLVTLSATVATLPVLALSFGEFSMISPAANLLAVLPGSLLVELGCLAAVTGCLPLLVPVSRLLFGLAKWIASYLFAVTDWLGATPLSAVRLDKPYLIVWLMGSLLFCYLGWRLLHMRGLRLSLALSLILLFFGVGTEMIAMKGVTTITALDAGDGTAVLMEKDGHRALVMTGDSAGLAGRVANALHWKGISRLDFVVLPGGDDRAVFEIGSLLEAVETEQILYQQKGDNSYQVEAFASASAMRCVPLENAQVSFWDDGKLVCREDGWLRISVGDTRLLFCPGNGDAAVLPDSWKQAHLVLYKAKPPANPYDIEALGGVYSSYTDGLTEAAPHLPWGRYPLYLTAETGDVTAFTRGGGDLKFAWTAQSVNTGIPG